MDKSLKRFLSSLLGIVLVFFGMQNFESVKRGAGIIMSVISPLLYGCAIAFFLNLIIRFLERFLTFGPFRNRTFRRVVTIILSLLILLAVIGGLVAGLIPEIKASGALLVEKLPGVIRDTVDFCVNRLGMPEKWFDPVENLDISTLAETLFQSGVIQQVLSSSGSFVGGAVMSILDFLIGLFFSFYILMQKEKLGEDLGRLSKAYLKPAAHDRLQVVMYSMNEIYSSFVSGQCLDAIILGTMVAVTLALFGIDYALLIGILVAFTALVPVVGSFLGGAIGVFLLMMVSIKDAVIFLIALLILQQVDNRLIYPHVVGNAVGLPAIWIFAALVIGGNMGGILGMLLAIPLFALIYALLSQDLRKREKVLEQEKEKEEEA